MCLVGLQLSSYFREILHRVVMIWKRVSECSCGSQLVAMLVLLVQEMAEMCYSLAKPSFKFQTFLVLCSGLIILANFVAGGKDGKNFV